jgi:hypothetical protein
MQMEYNTLASREDARASPKRADFRSFHLKFTSLHHSFSCFLAFLSGAMHLLPVITLLIRDVHNVWNLRNSTELHLQANFDPIFVSP